MPSRSPLKINSNLPFYNAWLAIGREEDIETEFDGSINILTIARSMGGKGLQFAQFLIDRLGLGIKDGFGWVRVTPEQLREKLDEAETDRLVFEEISEFEAQQIFWAAYHFGKQQGFKVPMDVRRYMGIVGELPDDVDLPMDIFGYEDTIMIMGEFDDIMDRAEDPEELLRRMRADEVQYLMKGAPRELHRFPGADEESLPSHYR